MANYEKRPSLDEFTEAIKKCGGNLTRVADYFDVSRQTVYNWTKDEPEFASAISDSRKRMFDKCLDVGYALALGIPELDEEKKVIGWKEKPDANMVRYLLGKLGKDEGFGDETDVNIDSNQPISINIVSATGDKIVP